jgi:PAS domain S-box-containing protein
MNDAAPALEAGRELPPAAYSRALLNILEDFGSERQRLEATQRAVLNILDDLAAEKARLEQTQQTLLRSEQAIRRSLQEKELLLAEISDKNRSMERLHSMQSAVFDQAPDAIFVTDAQGRIVEANERAALLFGHRRETLATLVVDDLLPPALRGRYARPGAAAGGAITEAGRNPNLLGLHADGSQFPIEVSLAALDSPDGERVIAIVKDVSEARRAEQLIRDSLKEKDLLLAEIHHRVKNNLQIVHSLLDMQASLTTDATAASALRDSQHRIQSMALIHQTLYQSHDFGKVDFGHFLDTLMTHLQNSYGRRDLELSSSSDTVRLAIDRAIPCGLIVNELVTNALKHAFPGGRSGSVRIEMRLLDEVEVEVAVTDDGIGIPDTVDLHALSSLGMQLLQVLAEQLHARLDIRRRAPTRIAFTFSLV